MRKSISLVGFLSAEVFPSWLSEKNINFKIVSHVNKSDLVVVNTENYKISKKDYLDNKNVVFYSSSKKFNYNWHNKLKPIKFFWNTSELKDFIINYKEPTKIKEYDAQSDWVERVHSSSDIIDLLQSLDSLKSWVPNIQSVGIAHSSAECLFMLKKSSLSLSYIKTGGLFSKSAQEQQNEISTKLSRAVGAIHFIGVSQFHIVLEGPITKIEINDLKELCIKYQSLLSHKMSILTDQYFLKKESLLWQTVFETVSDPAALFGGAKVLSSNKAFKEFNVKDERSKSMYQAKKYFVDKEKDIFFIRYESIEASRKLHQRALQQEKMAALGSVAGQIAHALNNPLTGILSMSQVLQKKYIEKESIREDLTQIEKAAVRCNKIVQNLRSYSNESSNKELVDVDTCTVLRDTMSFVKVEIGKYKYKVIYPDEVCMVKVNPQLLQQVFFNLIINATHAVGEDGEIEIKVYKKNKNIIFYVKDNGKGMSAEIQEKIFEPFFTTKIKDKGTGLGLSLVKDIVESFSGKIEVDSTLGSGSVFKICLPESIR